MSFYRTAGLWIAIGLAALFLTATTIETMVVLPAKVRLDLVRAITPATPNGVSSSRT
jgi:hypothetical protein